MDTMWKKIALSYLGCYPVKDSKKSYESLLYLLQLIDEKKSVLIFPEGKIIKKDVVSEASPGIGYAALKKNPAIMPVYVEGFSDVAITKALLRKYKATVIFGEAKRYESKKTTNPGQIAVKIVNSIYKLGKLK